MDVQKALSKGDHRQVVELSQADEGSRGYGRDDW